MENGITFDPNDPRLNVIKPNRQQEVHLALTDEEREKGFIRPVRYTYIHKKCGMTTTMTSKAIAETYARNPKFYGGTFCAYCGAYFDLVDDKGDRAFYWVGKPEFGVGE